MAKIDLEMDKAWEDLSFWQDLCEHVKSPEPSILKALEKAKLRYETAFQKWNQLKNNRTKPLWS